jgi:hypothetical protein
MAITKSNIVTAIDAANPPIANPVDYLGTVRQIPVVLAPDQDGAVALSKVLPATAKVIAVNLWVSALAGSATITVGDTTTANSIIASTSVSSAAQVVFPNAASTSASIDVGGKALKLTTAGGTYSNETIVGYILISTDE